MINTHVIRATFDDIHDLEHALKNLKESGREQYEAYGPVNLAEMEHLMPQKGSRVQLASGIGAVTGLVLFFAMAVYASITFGLIVGGKLPVSNVPFVVVAYEGTILLGAITAFIACLVFARMYPGRLTEPRSTGVTADTFEVRVTCPTEESKQVVDLLREAGAVEIDESQS